MIMGGKYTGRSTSWVSFEFRAVNSSAIARGWSAGSNSTRPVRLRKPTKREKNREQYNDLYKKLVVKVRSTPGSEH